MRVMTFSKLYHDVLNLIWTIQCTQTCLCIHQEDVAIADSTLEYSKVQDKWSLKLTAALHLKIVSMTDQIILCIVY